MWKLVWKDSLHFNKIDSYFQKVFTPFYLLYFNIFILKEFPAYVYIFALYFIFLLTSMMFLPIKLAKGLYLCPLTEADRKQYFIIAVFLRVCSMVILLGIILLVSWFFLKPNMNNLLLQFISCVSLILAITLISIYDGSQTVSIEVRKYYFSKNLPIPKQSKLHKKELQRVIYSNILLGATIVLGAIGVTIPMLIKEFNVLLFLYYIPTIMITVALFTIYFKRYFNTIVAMNANREVYDYSPNKKAGVFDAD